MPSDANIDKMWAYARKYAEKSGTFLHPDQGVTEAVVNGLATHIEQVGRPQALLGVEQRVAYAEDHLELVHLGLSSGEARDLLLRAARLHAEAALDRRPGDGGGHFLLGRVLLHLGEPALAAASLLRAAGCGVAELKLVPYLAEASFQRRRFTEVRAFMRRLPPLACRTQPRLDEMRAYWG